MGARKNRVGERHITNKGYEIEIIEYHNNKNVKIIFINDGWVVEKVSYSAILEGLIKTPKDVKIGEKHITNEGYTVTITSFIIDGKCDISFENGYIIKNRYYEDIKKGNVKNPFHKSIAMVGYIGDGDYKASRKTLPTKDGKT